MSTTRSAAAPAKINLTLRVGPLRPDGYHPLQSLVTRLELADEITVHLRPEEVGLTVRSDHPDLPADESNLALRAARRLQEALGARGGAAIEIRKRIPLGGGLGGGSSDAATTLKLLNDLWHGGLDRAALTRIAAQVGSDVGLFLYEGLVELVGRGEIVRETGRRLAAHAVLILPPLHCSTPAVYREFDRLASPAGGATCEEVLRRCERPEAMMELLFNDLEPAAFRVCPALGELAAAIRGRIGGPLCMSGSGSTLFRLFGEAIAAEEYARAVTELTGVRCVVTVAM